MTLQNILPFFFVFLAGVLVLLAVALNSTLGRMLNSPVLSALVVMAVGAVFMAILLLSILALLAASTTQRFCCDWQSHSERPSRSPSWSWRRELA